MKNLVLALLATVLLAANPSFAITGTWTGVLQGESGSDTVTYKFSADGNPILGFATRSGWQEVEVREVGQTKEWLLPGRGWARARVEALNVTADRVQVVFSIYRESGGGALIDQSRRRLGLDFAQVGAALKTTLVIESNNHSSGNGVGLYASSRGRQIFQGTLQRN
jgi:hypothetical protein